MSDEKKLSEQVREGNFDYEHSIGLEDPSWLTDTDKIADEIAALEQQLAELEGLRSGLAHVLNEGASIQRADDKDDVLIVQDDGSIIGNLSIYFPYDWKNTND